MIRMLGALMLICSPMAASAQGLPFHTETALTTAFEERGVRAFGASQSRGDADVFVSPLVILPHAPHQRVTTKVQLPLVYKHSRDLRSQYSNAGIGDLTLGVKWAFLARNRRDGTTRFAVAGSASLPTGSTDAEFDDGTTAPRPLQLGRGAVSGGVTLIGTVIRGPWGLSADIGHVRSMRDEGFRLGPITRYNLAIGFRVPSYIETIQTQTVQFYLEWNAYITAYSLQDAVELPNSGGHVAYLSPGAQWVVLPQLLIEASVQIPVIQDHNGTQPDFGIRPALGVRFLFF